MILKLRNILVFIRRIIFSIPGCVLFFLLAIVIKNSTLDGLPPTTEEYLALCVTAYIFICIPANIIIRAIQANMRKMKFRNFMLLPTNWYFKLYKISFQIQKTLHPNKRNFIVPSYRTTMQQLEKVLSGKKKTAEYYANIANTTLDEDEFHQAVDNCIKTLEWMSQFEKYYVFPAGNTPSDDIKAIKDNMPLSLEKLRKRMAGTLEISSVDYDLMDGHDFEYFCANILSKNGFINVDVTQGSGDHGIDILAEKEDVTYAIQCKRYSDSVGNAAVQQAHTGKSLYHRDIAVVLTNQYFTQQAKEEASALGVKLWDRDKLNEMVEKSSLK